MPRTSDVLGIGRVDHRATRYPSSDGLSRPLDTLLSSKQILSEDPFHFRNFPGFITVQTSQPTFDTKSGPGRVDRRIQHDCQSSEWRKEKV